MQWRIQDFPEGAPTYYLSYFLQKIDLHAIKTRMHSSRMRTARSLTVCPSVSRCIPCMPAPRSNHTHPPQSNHTQPPSPEQPCTPEQPRTLRATTHPPSMPSPEQPRMPPQSNDAPPRATTHAPPQSNHTRPPPVDRMWT